MKFAMMAAAAVCVTASVGFAQGRLICVDSSRALFEVNMQTGAKTQIGTVSANAGTTGASRTTA